MILTRTPYRVSLFGGGTDYPEWYQKKPGAVVGMAINKYCYVGVKEMPPGQVDKFGLPLTYRVQYSQVDDCQSPDEIRHPAVRAAVKFFQINTPTEFHIFGDLPGRSGLGGSSAFVVGLLLALRTWRDEPYNSTKALAEEAIRLERQVIKEAVGCQDQYFSAYGGVNFFRFSEKGCTAEPLFLNQDLTTQLENHLILVFSGGMRDAHEMAARQISEQSRHQLALENLAAMADEGTDLLCRGCFDELGELLHQYWLLKKTLCSGISNSSIDLLYLRALACGASGGKLLGAGGGGYLLFLVPPKKREDFIQTIGAPCVSFKVAAQGSHILVGEGK